MADPIERAVVASGEATVRRVPDLAVVSLSVTVEDRKPAAARDEANRRASAILTRLRELGLPDADVQAPSLVVQPRYDYSRGGGKVTGFEAARPMTIRVGDIDLLGTILDELVGGGATRVHGTSMELADPDAASREALAGAVAAARGRAEALASAAGVGLGEPLRIEEEEGGMPVPRGMVMLRAASTEAAPTEIATGEVEITARVRAWFAIT
ncbi:MAG TPA: SIMPL domain-containing protein [Candidatus Limnocylindria bacterium]|jgi:hypothetical protein